MDRAERFVHGRGAWMAFFAFIPILGSAISIVLGMMRANIWIVILAMTIGRYSATPYWYGEYWKPPL